MDYRIYQAKVKADYCFRSYEEAKGKIRKNDYILVTEGSYSDIDDRKLLNILFEKGNTGQLKSNVPMRSVSVSDIIQINNKYYYTDSFGFEDITFKEECPEPQVVFVYRSGLKKLDIEMVFIDLQKCGYTLILEDQTVSCKDLVHIWVAVNDNYDTITYECGCFSKISKGNVLVGFTDQELEFIKKK